MANPSQDLECKEKEAKQDRDGRADKQPEEPKKRPGGKKPAAGGVNKVLQREDAETDQKEEAQKKACSDKAPDAGDPRGDKKNAPAEKKGSASSPKSGEREGKSKPAGGNSSPPAPSQQDGGEHQTEGAVLVCGDGAAAGSSSCWEEYAFHREWMSCPLGNGAGDYERFGEAGSMRRLDAAMDAVDAGAERAGKSTMSAGLGGALMLGLSKQMQSKNAGKLDIINRVKSAVDFWADFDPDAFSGLGERLDEEHFEKDPFGVIADAVRLLKSIFGIARATFDLMLPAVVLVGAARPIKQLSDGLQACELAWPRSRSTGRPTASTDWYC